MDPGEAPGTSGDPPDPPDPMLSRGGEDFGQDLEGRKKRRAPLHTAIDPAAVNVAAVYVGSLARERVMLLFVIPT
jgi:hypothetical protein